MYFPGIKSMMQGDMPFLDGEIPAANGVVTARGLAKMYAALANGGRVDGKRFLSAKLAQGLIGSPGVLPDVNMVVPMPFHLGYHESPIPGVLKGFGHVGLGGTLGWADPDTRQRIRVHPQPASHTDALRHGVIRPAGPAVAHGDRGRTRRGPARGAAVRAPYPKPARQRTAKRAAASASR